MSKAKVEDEKSKLQAFLGGELQLQLPVGTYVCRGPLHVHIHRYVLKQGLSRGPTRAVGMYSQPPGC